MTVRSRDMAISGLTLAVGSWLAIAPFVLPYASGDPSLGSVVLGGAIGVLALARLAGLDANGWLSWANVVLGARVFASAFWLDESAVAAWNDAICGGLVFALSAFASGAGGPCLGRPRGRVQQRRQRPSAWR
ncbi:MAG: hypothetical protein AB7V58_03185 [Solirubrobacterales bacterium]